MLYSLIRRGQAKMDGGGIPEGYDSQPPPPQYNPAQYGRMPANQSYMSQQPPSYGAPPQTAQGQYAIWNTPPMTSL